MKFTNSANNVLVRSKKKKVFMKIFQPSIKYRDE